MGAHVSSPAHGIENSDQDAVEENTRSVAVPHAQVAGSPALSKSLPSAGAERASTSTCVRVRSSSASHSDATVRTVTRNVPAESAATSTSNISENVITSSPSTSSGSDSSFLSSFNLWKVVQTGRMKAHSVLNVGESSKRSPLRSAQSLENDRPSNSRNESSEDAKRGWRWRPWGSSSSSSEPDDDMDAISEMALQTIGLDQIRRTRAYSQGSWSYPGLKCPVCSRSVPPDDLECHLVICLTKPRLNYNEDTLTEEKGECVICFEDMQQGETIARLPCLCIYHKTCIDKWFQVNRSCPEHPED